MLCCLIDDDDYINSDNEPCGSEEPRGATPAMRAQAESISPSWRRFVMLFYNYFKVSMSLYRIVSLE